MAEISAQVVKDLRDKTGAPMMDCKKALTDANGDQAKAVVLLRERGLAKAVKRAGKETSEGTIALATRDGVGALIELGCETDFVAKTPDFQALAGALASAAVAADATTPEALLAANVGAAKGADAIAAAIAKIGENIQLKRVERLSAAGGVAGGYIHAGGKLGVLIGLATSARGDAVNALAKDLAMHVAAADPSPVAIDKDGVPKSLLDREAEIFRKQALGEGKPEKIVERIVEGRIKKYYSEVCLLEQPFVKDPDKSIAKLLAEAGGKLGADVRVTSFVRFRLGETAAE
ncbi:MAG TPA: translation elongation factor Ts [Myxococcota bacterium]|nr:translation elongation factor Ts [Myxococcota bacterium]